MISSEDELVGQADASVDLLLYDYFKHLTTLSLVALGGVLAIADGRQVERDALAMVVLLIGFAGGIALSALHSIARARLARKPLPWTVRWYRIFSGGAFSLGVGIFLWLFVRAI